MVRLRIAIVDQPGTLARIADVIGRSSANIIEVYHQRLFYDVPAKRADVDVVLETRNAEHVKEIIASLEQNGFPTRALSAHSAYGACSRLRLTGVWTWGRKAGTLRAPQNLSRYCAGRPHPFRDMPEIAAASRGGSECPRPGPLFQKFL